MDKEQLVKLEELKIKFKNMEKLLNDFLSKKNNLDESKTKEQIEKENDQDANEGF